MSGFCSRSVANVCSSVRPHKVVDTAMKPLPAMTLKTGCTPLTLLCCRKPRCLARLPLKQMANFIFCTRATSWTKDHMLLGKLSACRAMLKIPYSLHLTFGKPDIALHMYSVCIVSGDGVKRMHTLQTLLLYAGQTVAPCLGMLYWRSKGGVLSLCHGLTGKTCAQKQTKLRTLRQRYAKLCHSMQLMPGCRLDLWNLDTLHQRLARLSCQLSTRDHY